MTTRTSRLGKLAALGALVATVLCGPTGCGKDDEATGDDTQDSGDPQPGTSLDGRRQCFNVVGGVETTGFPSTVLLVKYEGEYVVSRCTGTFVGDNTVITAAHCVADTATGNMSVLIEDCTAKEFDFVDSVEVYHHGLTDDFFESAQSAGNLTVDFMARDLAVLVFPEDTAPAVSPLVDSAPDYGDEITMVGYGIAYTPDDPRSLDRVDFEDIKKRVGLNTLVNPGDTDYVPDRILGTERDRTQAADEDPGAYSTTAQGDSGGPVFLGTNLAGVTSSGAVYEAFDGRLVDIAIFVNLMSTDSLTLLKAAEAGGARFEGWDDYLDAAESSPGP